MCMENGIRSSVPHSAIDLMSRPTAGLACGGPSEVAPMSMRRSKPTSTPDAGAVQSTGGSYAPRITG
jgi:hypothetical protein